MNCVKVIYENKLLCKNHENNRVKNKLTVKNNVKISLVKLT